jgi:hypothetical protein
MTGFRSKKVYWPLRGIIQRMATFRYMRKMVAMLDELNDERALADKVNIETDGEYYPAIADKETVINHYVKLGYSDKPTARKIYRDLTSPRYSYIREVTKHGGRRVDVTAKGGDLIKTWHKVPTGLFKEYIDSNFNVLTVIIALVGGIIIGNIGAIIHFISKLA